jgi:hypothetical protein
VEAYVLRADLLAANPDSPVHWLCSGMQPSHLSRFISGTSTYTEIKYTSTHWGIVAVNRLRITVLCAVNDASCTQSRIHQRMLPNATAAYFFAVRRESCASQTSHPYTCCSYLNLWFAQEGLNIPRTLQRGHYKITIAQYRRANSTQPTHSLPRQYACWPSDLGKCHWIELRRAT